ncbi:PTS transporter subunit EIIC [Enterobacter hormaechei]
MAFQEKRINTLAVLPPPSTAIAISRRSSLRLLPNAGHHRGGVSGTNLQYGAGTQKQPGELSVAVVSAASKPITSALNYATLNFLNIGAVFLIGIELAYDGISPVPRPAGGDRFICVTPTTVEMLVDGEMHVVKDVLLRQFSDTRSLFLGTFIAILSVEIYCWLENRKGLKIRMPDTVPPNVAASFSALIPAIITTTAIATFGFVFHQITGMYLYDAVYQVVQQPLSAWCKACRGSCC